MVRRAGTSMGTLPTGRLSFPVAESLAARLRHRNMGARGSIEASINHPQKTSSNASDISSNIACRRACESFDALVNFFSAAPSERFALSVLRGRVGPGKHRDC